MTPGQNLQCFYCHAPFDGDPRENTPPGAPCPHCGETPLIFEFPGDFDQSEPRERGEEDP